MAEYGGSVGGKMVVERTRNARATSLAGIGLILVGMLAMVLAGLGASAAGAGPSVPAGKHWCPRTVQHSSANAPIKSAIATSHGGEQNCDTPPTTCSSTTTSTTTSTTAPEATTTINSTTT